MGARVVLASYMVRYPLGGMLSWVLQYLVGFRRLGHEIVHVEKAGWANACFDPSREAMTDDCAFGTRAVGELLARHGLGDRWCFVDAAGRTHGMSRARVEEACAGADVFIDMGAHGDWDAETQRAGVRVLLEAEPGFTQVKRARARAAGRSLAAYDFLYTVGQNVAKGGSAAPTEEEVWRAILPPVDLDLFPVTAPPAGAPFTTVMNWKSYEPVVWGDLTLRHKDVEFEKFADLPRRARVPLEIAVSGRGPSRERLEALGWRVESAHAVTPTVDAFLSYVRRSRGEFAVAKHGFVVTRSGWFSDRTSAYLASGRPAVLEETGFSAHLPCGEGLFAVTRPEEAAAALEEIAGDWPRHARAAREIAREHLDVRRVLPRFLEEVGVGRARPLPSPG
ncbi:MAG: hypothetical protein L0323_16610 [Planctomycetes bacterium]|nr:hypothetical protein [Planctomycetota bacterium]